MSNQKSYHNNKPTLYIVATPIGNILELSYRSIEVLNSVEYIACEDTRRTRKLTTHYNIKTKLISYHNYNEDIISDKIIKLLDKNINIALVSDGGYPTISDPGYILITQCINKEYNIVTISGSNACLTALIGSGLPIYPYIFYGFLPKSLTKAETVLIELEKQPYTLVLYETPHRIDKIIKLLYKVFNNRKCCICRELTKIHEEYIRDDLKNLSNITLDLKGEIVIVIEGYKQQQIDISTQQINKEINQLLKSNNKLNDIIKKLAKKYNKKKNEIYNNYHKC